MPKRVPQPETFPAVPTRKGKVMTKKDYIAVAAAIRNQRERMPANPQPGDVDALRVHWSTHYLIATSLADVFARDNPRFDRARFLDVCGVSQ